jgi:hypothetical protein
MGTFALQIGVMGWVCGKLPWPAAGYGIYIWHLALINLQAVVAWVFGGQHYWRDGLYAATLIAAELGIVIMWATLGAERWPVRWPIALVLATALLLATAHIGYWGEWGANSWPIFAVQSLLLSLAGLAIWWRGLRIQNLNEKDIYRTTYQPTQFGLRDVLLWLTAIGLVCGLIRVAGVTADEWVFDRNRLIPMVSAGIAMTTALVIAFCAVLAPRRVLGHWTAVVLTTVAAASMSAVVNWLDWMWQVRPWTYATARGELWWSRWYWGYLVDIESRTFCWLCLVPTMLVALLMFPQARGWRLTSRHKA